MVVVEKKKRDSGGKSIIIIIIIAAVVVVVVVDLETMCGSDLSSAERWRSKRNDRNYRMRVD